MEKKDIHSRRNTMENPFFNTEDSILYIIQKLLRQYRIYDEVQNIKSTYPNYFDDPMKAIAQCLRTYSIEAQIECDLLENIKTPSILLGENNQYLLVFNKSRDKYVIETFTSGKHFINDKDLESIYAGKFIKIVHVGRLKRKVFYTTFQLFVREIFQKEKRYLSKVFVYSIFHAGLLCVLLFLISNISIFGLLLLGSLLIIVLILLIIITYLQEKAILNIYQRQVYIYGHQRLVRNLVNISETQSEIIIHVIQDTMQWLKMYCKDIVQWVCSLSISIGKFHYFGVCVQIFIVLLVLLYGFRKQYIQRCQSALFEICDTWDRYLNTKVFLTQFQYQESYHEKMEEAFHSYEKKSTNKGKRKILSDSILYMVLCSLLIGGMSILYVFIQTSSLALKDILNLIVLITMQMRTTSSIILTLRSQRKHENDYETYKVMFLSLESKDKLKGFINLLQFHNVSTKKLQYVNITIKGTMFLKGDFSDVQHIFSLLIGEARPVKGSIYVNHPSLPIHKFSNIQQKIIRLQEEPTFLKEESIAYHLGNHPLLESEILLLMQIFKMEYIQEYKNAPISSLKQPLTLKEKQLIVFIRAIVLKPDILLIENALSAVDKETYDKIILFLKTNYPSVILVIYDSQYRRLPLFYQGLVINEGRISLLE